jgi:hypothetical protein
MSAAECVQVRVSIAFPFDVYLRPPAGYCWRESFAVVSATGEILQAIGVSVVNARLFPAARALSGD